MNRYKRISSSVLAVLTDYPTGVSITDLSERLELHRNVLTKYLKILEAQGKIDIIQVGNARYIKRSYRTLADFFLNNTAHPVIVFDRDLYIVNINSQAFRWFQGMDELTQSYNGMPYHLKEIVGEDVFSGLNQAVKGIKTEFKCFSTPDDDKQCYIQQCIPVVFDDGAPGAALLIDGILDTNTDQVSDHTVLVYQALLHDHIQFFVRFSSEGIILFMNRSFAMHLGYDDDNQVHPLFLIPYPEDEYVIFKEKIATINSREDVIEIEIRRVLPSGELCYERWRVQGFFDNNTLIEYHAIGLDITPFMRNEKNYLLNYEKQMQLLEDTTSELREANQDLYKEIIRREKLETELFLIRYAVDSAKDLMFILKSDGKIFFTNRKVEEITNIPGEELKGKSIETILIFQDDKNKSFTPFSKLLKNEKHLPITAYGVFSSSDLLYINFEVLINEVENLDEKFYYIIARDIHERLESERLLCEREKQYRFIADHTIDVTLLMNIEPEKILYVSPSCFDLLGISPEECLSKPLQTIIFGIGYEKVRANLQDRIVRYIAGDESAISEKGIYHLNHEDGSCIMAEMVTTLIKNDDDTVNQVFFVMRNMARPEIPEYQSSMSKYFGLWPKS